MRIAAIAFALVLCSAAHAQIPIVPAAGAPDYEMTIVERWGLDGAPQKPTTIWHHAGRVRSELVRNNRRTAIYSFGDTTAALTVMSGPPREGVYLLVTRGLKEAPHWRQTRTPTGRQESFLGETCEVWKTGEGTGPEADRHRLDCVTTDGIALWSRFVGKRGVNSNFEATSLKRRAVSPDEVRMPADWLDPKSWFEADHSAASGVTVNHRAVLQVANLAPGSPRAITRTRRQFGPWSHDDGMRGDGSRTVSIRNPQAGLSLDLQIAAGGAFQRLNLSRFLSGAAPVIPVEIDMKDAALGEDCRWFNTKPNMMDAGSAECRTADGLVLKERHSSWNSYWTYEAVERERGRVTLNEVLPPDPVFVRGNWAIPE